MSQWPTCSVGRLFFAAPLLLACMAWGAPNAPSNPGATAIAADSITWTWTDNSSNESGFKVWADPGTAEPTTLQWTTLPNATSYYQFGGITPNRQYSFQVAATNSGGDSAKTALFSAWTLAAVPAPPVLSLVAARALRMAIGDGDGNPPATEYAVKCRTTLQWVQADGTLGASPVYRTALAWGITTVKNLTPIAAYSFAAIARNGAGIVSEESLSAAAFTLAVVPNVVGQTQDDADSVLATMMLDVGQVTSQCSNTVAAGLIISQDPPADRELAGGSTVALVVSSGMCQVAVPNLVGQTQAVAEFQLGNAHFSVGTVSTQCSTTQQGRVISQNPPAGAWEPYGSAVSFVVSSGLCMVTVPNVVGLTQAAAEQAFSNAGLVVLSVTEQYSSTVAAGFVISEDPEAGTEVPAGNYMGLVVSKGPAPPITGSIVINSNRSATNNPVTMLALTWAGGDGGVVRMRFSNDGSTWTAWQSLAASMSYTLPTGDGHKTVRVQYLDKMNNRSAIFSDYIRLDTTLPTGAILINNGAATTTSRSVTLKLTWYDAGAQVSRMRFSDDGAHWTYWMLPSATKAYTLPDGLGYHTVRVQYLDGAGNYSASCNDYIKLVAP